MDVKMINQLNYISNKAINVQDLIKYGSDLLKKFGINNSVFESEILLCFALNKSREELLSQYGKNFNDFDKIIEFFNYIEMRTTNCPISKIIGYKEFFDHKMIVNKHVLDPRPDSEILIEEVMRILPQPEKKISILELGTGSGCLLITILNHYRNSTGFGIDRSSFALQMAYVNMKNNDLLNRMHIIRLDWRSLLLDNRILDNKFDLIISNPPYIDRKDMYNLCKEITHHEPLIALDGGNAYGTEKYFEIFLVVKKYLKSKGFLILEIGYNQQKIVARIGHENNFKICKTAKDLGGYDRCMVFQLV
jgi:release factor glutamine methyltransferase